MFRVVLLALALAGASAGAAADAATSCRESTPPGSRLPGDVNGDGRVTAADLIGVASPAFAADADVNGDGEIDGDDRTALWPLIFDCAGLFVPAPTPTATSTEIPPPSPTTTADAEPSATPTEAAISPTHTPLPKPTRTPTEVGPATPTPTNANPTPTPTAPAPTTTATPTRTATPVVVAPTSSPTPTSTSPGIAPADPEIASGAVAGAATGAGAIPSLLASIISGLQFGGSAAFDGDLAQAALPGGGGAGSCPVSGQVNRTCSGGGLGPVNLNFALQACTLATSTGSARIDGSVALSGSGFCPSVVLPPFSAVTDVEASYRNGGGMLQQIASCEVSASVDPDLGGSCKVTGADLVLTGVLGMSYADGKGVAMQMMQTSLDATANAFNPNCLPTDLTMKFDGAAILAAAGGSGSGGGAATAEVPVVFNAFTVRQDTSGENAMTTVNGGISSACFGGSAAVTTLMPLIQPLGRSCPTAGGLRIVTTTATVQVFYLADGSVGLDRDLDGVVDPGATVPSCLDPSLFTCPDQNEPTPTMTPTTPASATATLTVTETEAPTSTATRTATLVPTDTPSPTATRTTTATQVVAPTATPIPDDTETPITAPTSTSIPDDTETPAAAPTSTATPFVPFTPSATATDTPQGPPTPTHTFRPTRTPTSPPATATATETAVPTATFTETATPTATPSVTSTRTPTSTSTSTSTPTPTATGTPSPKEVLSCQTPVTPRAIPDGNATGITQTITIADATTIRDLDVRVKVTHTWVGDLRLTLTHVDSGKSVILLDRPGVPVDTVGCDGDDIDATFDDDVIDPAEGECLTPNEAILGALRPAALLSAFDGESLAGTWRLNLADLATQDTGAIVSWCIEANSRAPRVTEFTCEGGRTCAVPLNQSFDLSFSWFDPNGDAAQWMTTTMTIPGGNPMSNGQDAILPPSGSGTLGLVNGGYTCPGGSCSTTEFDWDIVVTDGEGKTSPPRRIRVVALGTSP